MQQTPNSLRANNSNAVKRRPAKRRRRAQLIGPKLHTKRRPNPPGFGSNNNHRHHNHIVSASCSDGVPLAISATVPEALDRPVAAVIVPNIAGPDRCIFNVVDDELVALSSKSNRQPETIVNNDTNDTALPAAAESNAIPSVSLSDDCDLDSPAGVCQQQLQDRSVVPVISSAIWHSMLAMDDGIVPLCPSPASSSSNNNISIHPQCNNNNESTTAIETCIGNLIKLDGDCANETICLPTLPSNSIQNQKIAAKTANVAEFSAEMHTIVYQNQTKDPVNNRNDADGDDDDVISDCDTEIVSPEYELHRPGSILPDGRMEDTDLKDVHAIGITLNGHETKENNEKDTVPLNSKDKIDGSDVRGDDEVDCVLNKIEQQQQPQDVVKHNNNSRTINMKAIASSTIYNPLTLHWHQNGTINRHHNVDIKKRSDSAAMTTKTLNGDDNDSVLQLASSSNGHFTDKSLRK